MYICKGAILRGMPVCSACESQLGEPDEELFDPREQEEPDGEHFKVVTGEKGDRFQCRETGQMAKPVDPKEEPNPDPSGAPNETQPEQEPQQEESGGRVYDLQEDKGAEDILKDVVTNPHYELEDGQIQEIRSWADEYDGHMPPDVLQELLSMMDGVAKQKASLIRQKYELKLNKLIKQQSGGGNNPSLSAIAGSGGMGGVRTGGTTRQKPTKEEIQAKREQIRQEQPEPPEPEPEPSGREKRQSRRQEAVDKATEELVTKMAQNMADDFGMFYSDVRQIATTVLKRKAEKDPDWFLEKADEFGMDIIDQLSEPSEARKEQMEGGGAGAGQSQVDSMIQDAMEDVGSDSTRGPANSGGPSREVQEEERWEKQDPEEAEDPREGLEEIVEQEAETGESIKDDGPVDNDKSPMTAAPETDEGGAPEAAEEEDDPFDKHFGDT